MPALAEDALHLPAAGAARPLAKPIRQRNSPGRDREGMRMPPAFDFVFSLFGLRLGLSLAEVLGGLARTLKQRKSVRLGWLTPLLGLMVIRSGVSGFGLGAARLVPATSSPGHRPGGDRSLLSRRDLVFPTTHPMGRLDDYYFKHSARCWRDAASRVLARAASSRSASPRLLAIVRAFAPSRRSLCWLCSCPDAGPRWRSARLPVALSDPPGSARCSIVGV